MSNTSLAKNKIRILLLEGVHKSALETFKESGYTNVEYVDRALSKEELLEKIPEFHFIGIRSRTTIDKEIIDNACRLVAIGCYCIGTNQIDLDYAMERGIAVFNAPFSNTRSVAELVLAEIILLMRRVPEKNWLSHEGIWNKSAKHSFEIRGKTLGIIGYGNIGSQLSVLAESVGMKVLYYDILPKLPLGNALQLPSLNHLFKASDVISLHVPETNETQNMVTAVELEKMKPGCILINASRGSVVNYGDLAHYIEKGYIGGAAVDVHAEEPSSEKEPFNSPLRGLKNVILTPHVGGSTEEAQENIGEEVTMKLIKYSDTGSTVSAVNFPQVSLTTHPGTHRLLHIHKNIPGIMSKINKVFSKMGVNIAAQYLQTNDRIGYVVIHVDKEYSQVALDQLKGIEGTIKTRVLY